VVGPMFAGKTTELIRRVERQVIAGRRAIVFKPSLDARYDASKVAAHNGLKFDAYVVPPDEAGVEAIYKLGLEYDVVAVDEVQFFPPSLADVLNKLADERIVIVAGLNLDFRGEPFETTTRVMAYADKVISLTAVCKVMRETSHEDATPNKRQAGPPGQPPRLGGRREAPTRRGAEGIM
jgi:thymidine kinase